MIYLQKRYIVFKDKIWEDIEVFPTIAEGLKALEKFDLEICDAVRLVERKDHEIKGTFIKGTPAITKE